MNEVANASSALLEIMRAFDEAWAKNDIDALMALYAPDATVESPLIAHLSSPTPPKAGLFGREGVCRGRDEIRHLVERVMKRGVRWGRHDPPVVVGNTIFIEYRRVLEHRHALAEGRQQADYVDVIEIEDGLIKSLRAYWGWHALAALTS